MTRPLTDSEESQVLSLIEKATQVFPGEPAHQEAFVRAMKELKLRREQVAALRKAVEWGVTGLKQAGWSTWALDLEGALHQTLLMERREE